ncbi:MAG: radical SAM protein [archaeon]
MQKLVKVTRKSGIPLIGTIFLGIIDRGTTLLQVRATTVCNLDCIFCSTSTANSDFHPYSFIVELDYLVDEVKKVVKYKGDVEEINIDSMGEPTSYSDLVKLVEEMSKLVPKVSMQTNGTNLTKKLIDDLVKAGLTTLNLSINSLDGPLAKKLCGKTFYDVGKIVKNAEYLSTKDITLRLCPVWIPKLNNEQVEGIIKLAKKLNASIGIQKYEIYRYSQKVKGIKPLNYWKFYDQLKKWEKEYDIKLKLTSKDLEIKKSKRLPVVFNVKDKLYVDIVCPGWLNGQMVGTAKGVAITVNNCKAKVGDRVKVEILENKNSIYVAKFK